MTIFKIRQLFIVFGWLASLSSTAIIAAHALDGFEIEADSGNISCSIRDNWYKAKRIISLEEAGHPQNLWNLVV